MARYFFNIRDGGTIIPDFEGSGLPDVEAARQEAINSARGLLAAKPEVGEVVDGQQFLICNEDGRLLEPVRIRDVFDLPK